MCAAEKAPGPDGCTMAFFQAFWETIKEEQMHTFHRFHSHHKVIMVIFEACSGLKINWRKSNIFPVKEVQQIQPLAYILRCRIEDLPIIYLGMPLGANHKAVNIWDGIIEKSEKRLALWKSQYLSLGGRVVLINVVLNSLPTYVMCLFPIPSEVVKILDKLRRDFFWQGSKIEKSFNLVKWKAVKQIKSFGGRLSFISMRGHGTPHSFFLGLFSISLNIGCNIQEMWSPEGWNLTFRRPLNDWEIPWKHHNDGIFIVNRVYKRGLSVVVGMSTRPWNTKWKSVAPNKVKCFTWLITCLAVGSEKEEVKAKKYGGGQSQPTSGGPFGRR
ncbi:hypothetical protein H5410_002170 [Solanum commersonii]|uniref:Uncharacterized protein n=1 Tax=Solanum commersonii TaxID=4109 RepID=A0A9J6B0X9_SOLCO|nr:hypothetical protein H5410_002170 [Solanum commersonii]